MSRFPRPRPLACALALAAALAAAQAAADAVPVVESSSLSQRWTATSLSAPAYPRGEKGQACVHLAFVVGRDGRVRDLAVLRRWASDGDDGADAQARHAAFAREAAAAAMAWRFSPATRNEQPVLTSANLAFDDRGRGHGDAIRAHCAVANLERFITDAQKDVAARGNLVKSHQDRFAVAYPWQITRDRHGWDVSQAGDAP